LNLTNNRILKFNFVTLAQYPAPLRLGIFLLVLLVLWLPRAALLYLIVSSSNNGINAGTSNLITILTMGLLFADFLFLLRIWGKKVYQKSHLLESYGLERTRRNGKELLIGLSIGLLLTLSLFELEGKLGWVIWQHPNLFLPKLILEGLLSALGIGLAEELVFRGWLLSELQQDYPAAKALWINATIFAIAHFIKPLPEIIRTFPAFPGLLLLGLTLVWAKKAHRGRLGISIGLHAGLVWGYYIINVGKMAQYSGQVPDWITGVDQNPLAGIMGLVFLSAIAFWMRRMR
jgi:membrane protease YdiL (CAAX protease family)